MNSNDTDTITIDLSSIESSEFHWKDADMTTGVIAQEIGTAFPDIVTLSNPGAMGAINTGISITTNSTIGGGSYTISTPYEEMEERLARLEKIIAEEEEVRRNHPAVKMAYDEYRLLYILSKKNPGDHLTEE